MRDNLEHIFHSVPSNWPSAKPISYKTYKNYFLRPNNRLNHRCNQGSTSQQAFTLRQISCICICATIFGLAIEPSREPRNQSVVVAAPIMLISLANHLRFCPYATWKKPTPWSPASWNGNCFWGSTRGFVSFKHVADVFYGPVVKFQLY